MILKPGTWLGPYEIVAAIEAGGMGSVFKARDRRLGREVAIKVLPVAAMRDERLVKRFTREARAAAALTHPNVVSIYDVGEEEVSFSTPFGNEQAAVRFLVEEFVEGASLRKLLRLGRPPLRKVVDIAIGIARGLVAAHEKGLIHRDLKPENILIDLSGAPKIADFGLVRWIYPETSAPWEEDHTGSLHDALTRTGYVVGTLGYMSPEQARGDESIGPESDLFVFGILLYELLTGVAPFARGNIEDSFTAILKERPPALKTCVPDVPDAIARLVDRCLEKEGSRRYPNAGEILKDLERVRRDLKLDREDADSRVDHVLPVTAPARSRRDVSPLLFLGSAVAVVFAFAGGLAVGGVRRPATSAAPAAPSWAVEVLRGLAPSGGEPRELAVSTDGRRLAFSVARGDQEDVFVSSPVRSGSEGRRLSNDEDGGRAPVFTRAGNRLLFSAGRSSRTGIFEAELGDAPAVKQVVANGHEPALSPDEQLLAFIRRTDEGSELWTARRDGTGEKKVLSGIRKSWRFPAFLADGKSLVLYDVRPGQDTANGGAQILMIALDDPRTIPFGSPRVDPSSRPIALANGQVLVRTWGDGTPIQLDGGAAEPVRLPLGAGLTGLAASSEARAVVTSGQAGDLYLWRR